MLLSEFVVVGAGVVVGMSVVAISSRSSVDKRLHELPSQHCGILMKGSIFSRKGSVVRFLVASQVLGVEQPFTV